MKPIPHGDESVGTFADVPYRPDVAAIALDVDDDDDDPEDRVRALGISREEEPTALALTIWARQVNTEKKFQPPFVAALRKIFKEQRDDVLMKLAELMPRARVSAEDLFDPADWVEIYEKRTVPILRATFESVGTDTVAELSQSEFVFNQAVKDTVDKQAARMIENVLKTTKDSISEQLRLGISNGEGSGQIAKRIQGVFKGASKHRARTIARTEIGRANSAAQLEGFEQSGVVEGKVWNHSLAANARENHLAMDGTEVTRGDSFLIPAGDTTPAEHADAPRIALGGGDLSAGNTINCRCFLTPVVG
jgi:uncharacterized protein with gpF-like domain